MSISAGRLDRSVQLVQPTATTNAINELITSWTVVSTVPAAYKPLNSTERFGANAVRTVRACKFHIRYRSDVTENWRVRYGVEEYRIIAINELGRLEGLELICEAIQ